MRSKDILELVNEHSGMDISEKSRKHNIVQLRFVYFYLCLKYSTESFQKSASYVNRDHSTMVYGIKEFRKNRTMEFFMVYLDVYLKCKSIIENEKTLEYTFYINKILNEMDWEEIKRFNYISKEFYLKHKKPLDLKIA